MKESVTNLPSLFPYFSFAFVLGFDKAQPRTYQYLCRKFDNDLVMGEDGLILCVPHGASLPGFTIRISAAGTSTRTDGDKEPTRYYFPDDEITKLLDQYNCNRCLNGYVPSKSS